MAVWLEASRLLAVVIHFPIVFAEGTRRSTFFLRDAGILLVVVLRLSIVFLVLR